MDELTGAGAVHSTAMLVDHEELTPPSPEMVASTESMMSAADDQGAAVERADQAPDWAANGEGGGSLNPFPPASHSHPPPE